RAALLDRDARHLLQRHLRAVVIHLQVLDEARVRPAGAQLLQIRLEVLHALHHARGGVFLEVFEHGAFSSMQRGSLERHGRTHVLAAYDAGEIPGIVEIEHPQRQAVVAAHDDGGGIHDVELLAQHAVEGQARVAHGGRIADITRAWSPRLSSASCMASAFITVASMPMWSAATRSMPARASPAPRKMLPPPITTATCTSICLMSCSSPAMRRMTAGSMP